MDPSTVPHPEKDSPATQFGQRFHGRPASDRIGDHLTAADWKALAGWLNPDGYHPTGQVGAE